MARGRIVIRPYITIFQIPICRTGKSSRLCDRGGPEYSLEGLMLKLKLQYFGHLMRRADSFEKTLMLGKIEGKKYTHQTHTTFGVNHIDDLRNRIA